MELLMRQIKLYLYSLIPLFIVIFSITVLTLTARIFNNFQNYIKKEYSIVVVSNHDLELDDLRIHSKMIVDIERVSTKKIVEDVENSLSKTTAVLLSKRVPNFYKVYFDRYPSNSEVEQIKEALLTSEKISRVDTFKNIHQQTYRFLFFITSTITLFTVVLSLTSIFLIIRQVEVWFYQHKKRMDIMKIFGASVMMRSKDLRKVAFWNSIVSTVLVVLIIYFIKDTILSNLTEDMEFVELIYNLDVDLIGLFFISILVSHFPVFMVVYQQK
jgi:cell division transport system permease protein